MEQARACPACGHGRLSLKTSASGGFVGCSNYPACAYLRPLMPLDASQAGDPSADLMQNPPAGKWGCMRSNGAQCNMLDDSLKHMGLVCMACRALLTNLLWYALLPLSCGLPRLQSSP